MVKTTRVYSGRTTRRLTRPLAGDPTVRALGAALLGVITLAALVVSAHIEAGQPIQEAQPLVARPQIVYIIATPSPMPAPTAEPAMVAAPPTAAPEVIYATVEVPVYVEVQSAPAAPAAEEWQGVPFVAPGDVCASWRPPLILPEGCS